MSILSPRLRGNLPGKSLAQVFPRFAHHEKAKALEFANLDATQLARDAEVIFLALPHGLAAEFAKPLLQAGARVIDLSADFRVKDAAVYKEFYGHDHPAPDLLGQSVYGLPEIYRDEIRTAKLIACPGCYPTSILIPLRPLIRRKAIDRRRIRGDKLERRDRRRPQSRSRLSFRRVQRKHAPLRRAETSTSFRDRAGAVDRGRRKNRDPIHAASCAGKSRDRDHDLR